MSGRLHIDAESTRLEAGTGRAVLAVGDAQLVRAVFGGGMPDTRALEHAIGVVEDALMAVASPVTAERSLAFADDRLHAWVSTTGDAAAAPVALNLAAVERLFARLAAVADGSPASHQGLPRDARLAARLVILRELMHHWRIPVVVVDAST